MKRTILTLLFISILTVCTGCMNSIDSMIHPDPVNIQVSAVSSLRKPLEEIKSAFESQENITVEYNFDSSQNLTDQFINGELSPDMLILSSQMNMNTLSKEELVTDIENLIQNSLILIGAQDSKLTGINDITNWEVSQLAISDPQKTSSGHYALDALKNMNLYSEVESKIVEENNVRAVMEVVGKNEADAGIVFKTDIFENDRIKQIYEFPLNNYDSIIYPMAATTLTEKLDQVETFEEFLKSPESQTIFSNYGFTTSSTNPEAQQNSTGSDTTQNMEDTQELN